MASHRPNWFLIAACAVAAAVLLPLTPVINRRLTGTVLAKLQHHRLEAAQRDLAAARSDYDRWLKLTDVVVLEVGSTPPAEVRSRANEVLANALKYRSDWNYGNAIHKGNLALGRLALREGKIDAAEEFLLRAGGTPGSPQLDSFGPNMLLAKELLENDRREKVLEYFALCGKFWEVDHGQLKQWTAQVRARKEPDFGANLIY